MLNCEKELSQEMCEIKACFLRGFEDACASILKDYSGVDKITLSKIREILSCYEALESLKGDTKLIQNSKFMSALFDKNTDFLQKLIDSGITALYIDEDIHLSKPLVTPSNFEVIGMGGTIYTNTGSAFIVRGSVSDDVVKAPDIYDLDIDEFATSVDTQAPDGTPFINIHTISEGDDIFVRGTQNLVSRDAFTSTTLREKYYLCEGTTSSRNCFAGMLTKLVLKGTFQMSFADPFGWYYNDLEIRKADIKRGVIFKNVKIVNTSETINREGIIAFEYASECAVENCEIISTNGCLIATKYCKNIKIANNKLIVTAVDYVDHAENNMIRIMSTTDSDIVGNTITGGTQNVDITYTQNGTVSYNITVRGNDIYATDTGVNTHPATYKCTIDGNHIVSLRKGIAIRGAYHTVCNNVCEYIGTSVGYGLGNIEGHSRYNKFIGNTLKNFDYACYVHEDITTERDNRFPASLNVDFIGNTVEGCDYFLYVRTDDGATATAKLNINAKDNSVYGNKDLYPLPTIFSTGDRGAQKISCVNITNNTFANFVDLNEYDINCNVNFLTVANNVIQTTTLHKGNSGLPMTISGTAFNNVVNGTIEGTEILGGIN